MSKRRINFVYCASAKSDAETEQIIFVETALAINGIKAVGYTAQKSCDRSYDWEMLQKGANISVVKGSDMVIFDNYVANDPVKESVLQEAQKWGIPVYVFSGNGNGKDVQSFNHCITACKKLLGSCNASNPILIK